MSVEAQNLRMLYNKTPGERAALIASAKQKQAAAMARAQDFDHAINVAGLTKEQFNECRGLRLMYDLTRDEYEALWESGLL